MRTSTRTRRRFRLAACLAIAAPVASSLSVMREAKAGPSRSRLARFASDRFAGRVLRFPRTEGTGTTSPKTRPSPIRRRLGETMDLPSSGNVSTSPRRSRRQVRVEKCVSAQAIRAPCHRRQGRRWGGNPGAELPAEGAARLCTGCAVRVADVRRLRSHPDSSRVCRLCRGPPAYCDQPRWGPPGKISGKFDFCSLPAGASRPLCGK